MKQYKGITGVYMIKSLITAAPSLINKVSNKLKREKITLSEKIENLLYEYTS